MVGGEGLVLSFFQKLFGKSKNQSVRTPVSLEDQIETLAEIGIRLNKGIGIEELLLSYERATYENDPYGPILFTYGNVIEKEPWTNFISDDVWEFDVEFIEGKGSYATIMTRFAALVGQTDALTEIHDDIDGALESSNQNVEISYKLNGKKYDQLIKLDDDWADPDFVSTFMTQLSGSTAAKAFYAIDNGQSSLWLYLSDEDARKLQKLTKERLKKT